MQSDKPYVSKDEHGVFRVGSTRVMLDSVVAAFHQGHSAETIQQQYPTLTLEETYGAIAYYLANKELVDSYLRNQDELWQQQRAKAGASVSPALQRLRSLATNAETDAQ